jgi:MSHA biogenesis protein MshL
MTAFLQKTIPVTRSDEISGKIPSQANACRFSLLRALKPFIAAVLMVAGFAMALPQGRAISSAESTLNSPRFTLNLKDVNLREALMLLTKNSAYSLIMDPGIDIVLPTLDLKEVTVEEALQSILPGLGLEYRIEGKILKIGKPSMQTRTFNLNFIAASRNGKRDMRMSSRSQGGGNSGSAGNSGPAGVSGGIGQSNSGAGGGSSSENESTLSTSNTSAVWMDLRLGLENIIFQGPDIQANNRAEESGPAASAKQDSAGRRLLINPQAGLIMIHAEPGALEEAAHYIEAVENSVQRQVLIEARVVEVTLSKDHQMGVNWSAILNPTSRFSGLLSDSLGVTKPSISLDTGSITNQNVNASLGQAQYSISNGKVGAIITALSRQGNLRVLSSPHIAAMNNQKAVIRVVREEVFFTQTSLVSQSVGPTVTTENVQNQIVPIGVVLDIIPQIAADGEIILSINPSISELVEVRTFSSSEGNAVSTQPVIDRRDLDTVAKVHSGETILIAGIIQERKSEDMRGFPVLMHLPILGNAFRRTEQSSSRTELVIFITPTLIDKKSMAAINEEENQRLQEMERSFKPKASKSSKPSKQNKALPQ